MEEIVTDELYLLQILPDVVWKKILDKVDNSDDFGNTIKASPYFRNHLLSKRTTFLFEKVFKFLAIRYDKSCLKFYDDVTDHEQVDGGRIWKYPGGYRMVCSKWNQTVQIYYQRHISHYWTLTDVADIHWPPQGRCAGYYEWEHISEAFLEYFQDTHNPAISRPTSCPVFRRALSIQVSSLDVGSAANEVTQRFLQTYGQDIWYLSLRITNTSDTLVDFYFALKDLLELVPNLLVLRLWYIKTTRTGWRAKSRLRKAIKICPLNKFPKLKFLEVLTNLPAPILNELLVKNTQVFKLDILAAGHDILSLNFPNLQSLFVRVRSKYQFDRLFRKGKNWKLKAFRVMLTFREPEESLKEIFKMVERNWSETLQHLHIWKISSYTERKRLIKITTFKRLYLPRLNVFKLDINYPVALDFLLPAARSLVAVYINPTSEFKKINQKKYKRFIRAQKVNFLGFEENLERSNIWKWFPKLNILQSGAGTFYRHGFISRQNL